MRYLKEMKEKWTDDLEETSVTGGIDGGAGPPRTPHAFSDEEDENDNAEQSGLKKMKKTKTHTKVVESIPPIGGITPKPITKKWPSESDLKKHFSKEKLKEIHAMKGVRIAKTFTDKYGYLYLMTYKVKRKTWYPTDWQVYIWPDKKLERHNKELYKSANESRTDIKADSKSLFKKMISEMYGINDIEESISKPSKYQIGTHPVSREDLLIHMFEKEDGDWKMTTPAKDKEAVKALVKKYGMENVAIDGTQRNGDPATYVFVNEAVSYREFKKDPTSSPSQKVNKGIAEVNKMLAEIEKIVHNNLKLKQESGVDSSHFWKSTGKRFLKINERITKISNRLKELSQ